MEIEAVSVEVAKLAMSPGQILAVKCKSTLSMSQREEIAKVMKSVVPEGVKILVLDKEFDICVVEPPNTDFNLTQPVASQVNSYLQQTKLEGESIQSKTTPILKFFEEYMKIKKVNKMNKDELGKRIKKYSKFHDSKFYNHLKAALEKFK